MPQNTRAIKAICGGDRSSVTFQTIIDQKLRSACTPIQTARALVIREAHSRPRETGEAEGWRTAAGFRAAAPDSCRWFYQGMPSAFVRNSIKGVVLRQTATYRSRKSRAQTSRSENSFIE